MKINVPFYESQTNTDCGPLSLKMVAEYLGKELAFEEISTAVCQLKSGMTWSAGILKAAREFGFDTVGYSQSNFSHDDLAFYKKHISEEDIELAKEILESNRFVEKDLSLDELLSFISEHSVPIVLLNWFVVRGNEGFSGHFVPVVGFDSENVYVHNPGLKDPMAFMPIPGDAFVKAWESEGTDKDLIVVRKN